jgi:CBS domain-containing protein
MDMSKIRVHDVITCGLNEEIINIKNKLKEKEEKRIYIVDPEGKLKGVLTTTDIVYGTQDKDITKFTAKDLMRTQVESIDINESHKKALEIMNKFRTFMCPITKEGKLIGALSYEDVLAYATTAE